MVVESRYTACFSHCLRHQVNYQRAYIVIHTFLTSIDDRTESKQVLQWFVGDWSRGSIQIRLNPNVWLTAGRRPSNCKPKDVTHSPARVGGKTSELIRFACRRSGLPWRKKRIHFKPYWSESRHYINLDRGETYKYAGKIKSTVSALEIAFSLIKPTVW